VSSSQAFANLDQLERWMQDVVTHPGGVDAGAAASTSARASIDDVFLPSQALTAAERVGVYAFMYFDRLIEVLEDEFRALASLVGEETLRELLRAYVIAQPSTHYSLNVLSAALPAWLADRSQLEEHAFLSEVARVERSLQEVFDGTDSETIATDDLLAVPMERWPELRLRTIPALELHRFDYPVNAWYRAWREERPREIPAERTTWLAVYRREFRVWRMDLTEEAHAMLSALQAGDSLGVAIERAATLPGADPSALAGSIQEWFQSWSGDGLFAAIEDAR